MIKAGIKKELMLFTRGFKLLGVIITIVAISLLYPFTYKSMELMANQISDMGQQMGGETQGQVENAASSINNMLGSISEMYGGSMAAVGFKTGVSSLTSTGCNNVTAYVSRRRRTEKTLGNNTYLCRTVTLRLCNA